MKTLDAPHDNSRGVVRWIAVADVAALRRAAVERIVEAASRAIQQRGMFLIVLAGGDTPRSIYRSMRDVDTDWSCWHVFFGDERCLPASDGERNSRMAADAWLDHVAIPLNQVHAIHAELGAEIAAQSYSNTLSNVGDFDLVLLGIGEDGHTASLFPGHDWGIGADAPDVLAVFDVPKPPPQRVSLTAARLSRARAVVFLVTGESKRAAVAQWVRRADIPARAICPDAGIDVVVEASLLTS